MSERQEPSPEAIRAVRKWIGEYAWDIPMVAWGPLHNRIAAMYAAHVKRGSAERERKLVESLLEMTNAVCGSPTAKVCEWAPYLTPHVRKARTILKELGL